MTDNGAVQAVEVMRARVSPVVAEAQSLAVADLNDYALAGEFLAKVKILAKDVEDKRTSITRPMNEALRNVNEMFRSLSDPLYIAEKNVKGKMSAWYAEQERIRVEAERRALAEARAKEEAERARLQKAAEKAEAKGNAARAADLKQQAAEVYIAPQIEAEDHEIAAASSYGSVSMRKDIEVQVENPYAILEAVLNETLPMTFITIKEAEIKRYAKASGIGVGSDKIPGVRIIPAINAAVRTNREGR